MKPTLLVLAAGMGSRYGGLKQIEPIGPDGQVIIEYSVFDAIRAGFGKVVFVIRKEFEEAFKTQLACKFDSEIKVEYVFQELDTLPDGFELPADRVKPWGTGHAILMAKDVINEPFAAINADDFYGASGFKSIAEYLSNGSQNNYAMVGYALNNTLSEYGYVSRGVCQCDKEQMLDDIVERTQIVKTDGGAVFTNDDGNEIKLTGKEIVSMNFWGFKEMIFEQLETQFVDFLKLRGNELKSEFFIPTVVDNLIKSGQVDVKVLKSEDSWFGVTYQQDKDFVKASIAKLIDSGTYPKKLW